MEERYLLMKFILIMKGDVKDMDLKHHTEEWENCERQCDIMAIAHAGCKSKCDRSRKTLQKVVKEIILYFEPDFFDTCGQLKPCKRKLKYIGDPSTGSKFFIKDEVYESIDFNGATYSIKGFHGRVGCLNFVRLT